MSGFSFIRAPDDTIVFDGVSYHLTLYFDKVLEAQQLLSDDDILDETEAQLMALYLLCEGTEQLSLEKSSELLIRIFREYINGNEENSQDDSPPVFDFVQDAEYIYSSFLMDYGMDLRKQCGKLLWCDFIALFKGLSERTKIREVMSIRSRPMPEPTKYNRKEIEALTELKRFYALKTVRKENNFAGGLAALAEALKGSAIING